MKLPYCDAIAGEKSGTQELCSGGVLTSTRELKLASGSPASTRCGNLPVCHSGDLELCQAMADRLSTKPALFRFSIECSF